MVCTLIPRGDGASHTHKQVQFKSSANKCSEDHNRCKNEEGTWCYLASQKKQRSTSAVHATTCANEEMPGVALPQKHRLTAVQCKSPTFLAHFERTMASRWQQLLMSLIVWLSLSWVAAHRHPHWALLALPVTYLPTIVFSTIVLFWLEGQLLWLLQAGAAI